MKIEELRQHRALTEMLDCVDRQLESKEIHDAVLGDSGEPAHEQVTVSVEGYIHGIGTINLLVQRKELERRIAEIDDYIAAIPVYRVRKALELNCKEGLSWRNTAHAMGEESEVALQRYVARYIKQIEQTKL